MSAFKDHVDYELKQSGLLEDDSDYGGDLGRAVLELTDVFSDQNHSGMSASIVIEVFTRLAKYKPLGPTTDDPGEWNDVSDMSGRPMWQNRRQSSRFSNDGGRTYWDTGDKATMWRRAARRIGIRVRDVRSYASSESGKR